MQPSAEEQKIKSACLSTFSKLAAAAGVARENIPEYYDAVFTIALAIVEKYESGMMTVGISGAQGSGKSSISRMLQSVLEDAFSMSAGILSIDDFYLTREERLFLGREVHPMLAVRGVPGTHDMSLLWRTISQLKAGLDCTVPIFSKGNDDRLPDVRRVNPTSVLILEGWCWGADASSDEDLLTPVNKLEADQDLDLVWRRYVNQALTSPAYRQCFSNDLQIFLAVPDMESVFNWRLQQEQQIDTGKRVMNAAQVRNFIMYYQRITEHMLKEQPAKADFTLRLRHDHGIGKVLIKQRLM